jgi:hypothetical protein
MNKLRFTAADSAEERKEGGNTEGRGHNGESACCRVSHIFISVVNLAKAAGLATMISTMRPDIDHADEYVRNTTARAFNLSAFNASIVVLIDEKWFDDNQDFMNIGPDQIIQLVKVIDRILYKLDDLVRPYVHKILVVIEPLLIDQVARPAALARFEIISRPSTRA